MGIQALFCLARTQDPAPDKALQSLCVCSGTSRREPGLQGLPPPVSRRPRLLQVLARGGFAGVLQGIKKDLGVPAWPLQGNKSPLLCAANLVMLKGSTCTRSERRIGRAGMGLG